jgi:hypothetical protein
MGFNREPKHLLDNAEQNVGNSEIIPPQVGPGGPLSSSGTTVPQSNPPRILQLSGPSDKGQTTSVVMTGYPGPITGIIEFGNGGRSTKVEFDIPVGPFLGNVQQAAPASEPQDGGVIVTVPTGVLRAYARQDNLLMAPTLNTPTNAPLAILQGVAFIGPGGPVTLPQPPPNIIRAEPVMAKAMAAYFSRHTSTVYKTLYLFQGVATPAYARVTVGEFPPPAAVRPLYYALPAFTRSVKILRLPTTTALVCRVSNGIYDVDEYNIPAGSSSPIIPIIGNENIISLASASNGVGDQVFFLALSCEIGI